MSSPSSVPRIRHLAGCALPVLVVLVVVVLGIPSAGAAADGVEVPRLFSELEGKLYERRAWNGEGELTDLQALRIGLVRQTETGHAMLPAELVSYRLPEQGEPDPAPGSFFEAEETGRVQMEWRLKPASDPEVGLDLLGLVSTEKRDLKVELLRMDGVIYPEPIEAGPLPDVRIVVKMRKGVLSFLGARTVIRLRERTARVLDDEGGRPIEIRSRVSAAFKVIGIPWKKPRFANRQRLTEEGLVEVVLQPRKGGRQSIRLVEMLERSDDTAGRR